jgi:hypothetical protein
MVQLDANGGTGIVSYDPSNAADRHKRNVAMIIEALPADGSGVYITELSERCWGTSGRGNSTIMGMIRAAGQLGYIRVERQGRRYLCSRKQA